MDFTEIYITTCKQRGLRIIFYSTSARQSVSGAVAQLVRVPDCRSGGCGFESRQRRLTALVNFCQGFFYALWGKHFPDRSSPKKHLATERHPLHWVFDLITLRSHFTWWTQPLACLTIRRRLRYGINRITGGSMRLRPWELSQTSLDFLISDWRPQPNVRLLVHSNWNFVQ